MKNTTKYAVAGAVIVLLLVVAFGSGITGNVIGPGTKSNTLVLLETTEGNIVIELYSKDMPITTGNFEKLVKEGYYDGIIFHRVIDGFMIQGGDPTGTGAGGPGYTIEDEFVQGSANVRGTISMANTGAPNSGGSQFFINLVDNTFLDWDKQPLSSKHPAFGKVIEGMDVVDKIGKTQTDQNNRPVEEIKIIKASIIN
jgi:peptidylprolyl isomerase